MTWTTADEVVAYVLKRWNRGEVLAARVTGAALSRWRSHLNGLVPVTSPTVSAKCSIGRARWRRPAGTTRMAASRACSRTPDRRNRLRGTRTSVAGGPPCRRESPCDTRSPLGPETKDESRSCPRESPIGRACVFRASTSSSERKRTRVSQQTMPARVPRFVTSCVRCALRPPVSPRGLWTLQRAPVLMVEASRARPASGEPLAPMQARTERSRCRTPATDPPYRAPSPLPVPCSQAAGRSQPSQ